MRFLMLNWRDPGNPLAGGAERVTLGYLAALVRRGHEAYWFSNGFAGCDERAAFEGVQIVRGGSVGSSILRARAWLKRQPEFDLVIDQHHGIPWFAPWWCGTRSVAMIHEVLGPIWHSFYSPPLAALGRWQERWLIRLYRRIPFWSACPSTREALLGLGVKGVTLIPYGVETKPIVPYPGKRLVEPIRLAVVSRLAPNKRIEHAIEAVRILRARGREVFLSIAGEGEMMDALVERVRRWNLEEVVRFEGRLDEKEKDALLAQAHLLLHASVREGWGLNVIEANCMGTPAVVYPVAGLIESTITGETGWVVAKETPAALADGVEQFLSDPALYERCRRGAWERSGAFHWSQVLPAACDWLEAQARS